MFKTRKYDDLHDLPAGGVDDCGTSTDCVLGSTCSLTVALDGLGWCPPVTKKSKSVFQILSENVCEKKTVLLNNMWRTSYAGIVCSSSLRWKTITSSYFYRKRQKRRIQYSNNVYTLHYCLRVIWNGKFDLYAGLTYINDSQPYFVITTSKIKYIIFLRFLK